MKVKDLKKILGKYNDECEVAIDEDEELYDCYCEDRWILGESLPRLVIAKE